MKALLKREFELTNYFPKTFKHYLLLSLGLLVAAWLLGPNVIGFRDSESLSLYLTIIIFGIVNSKVSTSIQRDITEKQKMFLQTLPVKTEHIVHAKYISVLLWNCVAFIWAISLSALNTLMNHGEWSDLLFVYLISSMLLFISSTTIGCFFLWNDKRINVVFYVSLVVWLISYMIGGFFLTSLGFSWTVYMAMNMVIACIIFGGSWLVVMNQVKSKGMNFS